MLRKVKPVEPAGNSTSLCETAGDTEEMLSSGDTTTAASTLRLPVFTTEQFLPLFHITKPRLKLLALPQKKLIGHMLAGRKQLRWLSRRMSRWIYKSSGLNSQ